MIVINGKIINWLFTNTNKGILIYYYYMDEEYRSYHVETIGL